MTDEWTWFVLDVNPEPWAIGDLSVGRKGGKYFPMVGRNQQLWFYKQAIKEAIGETDFWIDGPIDLMFFFWRDREEYKTPQARSHRKHEADTTNLQKATEDALQGVLFKNDKDVRHVESWMVEQGAGVEGKVVIAIRKLDEMVPQFPFHVLQQLAEIGQALDNTWEG